MHLQYILATCIEKKSGDDQPVLDYITISACVHALDIKKMLFSVSGCESLTVKHRSIVIFLNLYTRQSEN